MQALWARVRPAAWPAGVNGERTQDAMDSFEWNKIIGAVLGTGVFAMGLGVVSDILFSQHPPEKPGYVIEVAEAAPSGEAAPAAPKVSFAELLAKADVAKGQAQSKKCLACHSLDKGGPNKIGPDLWGVVDRPVAHHEGFSYSEAVKAFAEGGKTWTYENLDHFLAGPKAFIPGTAMGFAGIKNDQDRADLVAYLRTLSDSPVPLPTVEAAASAEAPKAEPAAGAAPTDAPKAEAAPATGTPATEAPAAEAPKPAQ